MGDWQRDLAREEFAALRATIRERGSLRVTLFLVTLIAWAAAMVTPFSVLALPTASLVRLLVLAAGIEAIVALHLGVERVGRYLEVRFEEAADGPAWERTAMAWGQQYPGTGTDPLFGPIFALAVALNLASVLLAFQALPPATVALQGLFHALALWRLAHLRSKVRRQRPEDLARFRELLAPRR